MGDWGNFGKRKAKFGKRPSYAPNPLRGGATKGARGGRFWSKRGDAPRVRGTRHRGCGTRSRALTRGLGVSKGIFLW